MADTNQQPAQPTGAGHRTTQPGSSVGGVDVVAGQPPVPLSVWYRTDDGPRNSRNDLARKIIEQYSHPGQVVLGINSGADLSAAALAADRVYLSLPHAGLLVDLTEVHFGLVVVGWPYSHDPRDRSTSTEQDLAAMLRSRLTDAGHVVIVFNPPPPGILHAERAAPLIAAATRVGLGHRQTIVYLDTGLCGGHLDTTRLRPAAHGWPPGWQHQAHRYLLVLSVRAGHHG
jgi:hypothetical protein